MRCANDLWVSTVGDALVMHHLHSQESKAVHHQQIFWLAQNFTKKGETDLKPQHFTARKPPLPSSSVLQATDVALKRREVLHRLQRVAMWRVWLPGRVGWKWFFLESRSDWLWLEIGVSNTHAELQRVGLELFGCLEYSRLLITWGSDLELAFLLERSWWHGTDRKVTNWSSQMVWKKVCGQKSRGNVPHMLVGYWNRVVVGLLTHVECRVTWA